VQTEATGSVTIEWGVRPVNPTFKAAAEYAILFGAPAGF
jgi:hypothetical protein